MNWTVLLQGLGDIGIFSILVMIGSVYREHKIMWRWFEETQIKGSRRAHAAGAD